MAGETEQIVHRVVVVAADSCCAAAGRFGLEIQHLADEATLPEQPAVKPLAVLAQRLLEARDHAEAKKALFGDALIAR